MVPLSFSFRLNHGFLWGIFALATVVFVVISAVLLFHWRRYSLGNKTFVFTETIYFLVSGLLFFIAIISLIRL